MEINTNIIIGGLFLLVMLLLFSKLSVSVGSTNPNNQLPILNTPMTGAFVTRNEEGNVIATGKPTFQEVHGMPKPDGYMSNSLKSQIEELENKFYYNNCKLEPNF
jgi:hypothetical protein